ncbi:unnamed protein product [Ranitomeya imitator]|uniref:DNA repair protein SWI5 homolog n=1 Tax=Ranitomeya imitator TaxID=111125 RepID=A0ABN9MNA9_9NEOB|nr:unnamed protein product [Ranitomeya imitator]
MPRPGSGLRRSFCHWNLQRKMAAGASCNGGTPLGIRGRCRGGFKSPVQSPSVSKAPAAHEEDLQREISDLKHKERNLDEEIRKLEAEGFCVDELDEHISLLHEYNELKDTGQMLLGRLVIRCASAEKLSFEETCKLATAVRGVTTKDLYAEFGLDLDD